MGRRRLLHLLLLCLNLPFLNQWTTAHAEGTGPWMQDGVPVRWNNCPWCCSPENLLPVTPELANQPPRGILVILRGISYSMEYRQGAYDYRRTSDNFFSHVVEPWRRQGHTVDVAVSTYNSSMLEDVMRTYQPVFAHVAPSTKLSIMVGRGKGAISKLDLVLAGLEAAEHRNRQGRWDTVVLTRFDLEMRQPVTSFAIDFEKLNFLWKERPPANEPWAELPRVADAVQVIPSRFLESYTASMRVMAKAAKRRPGVRGITLNNGHRILMTMEGVDIHQDVQLLSNETCRSDFRKVNPFYREAVADEQLRWQPKAWRPMMRRVRRRRRGPNTPEQ